MATATPQAYPPNDLKRALEKLTERRPLTPVERDESPAVSDDWADVTPEERDELEAEALEAEEDLRAGRCIPVEKVFADRGCAATYPRARCP